jgi:hypothetical protein
MIGRQFMGDSSPCAFRGTSGVRRSEPTARPTQFGQERKFIDVRFAGLGAGTE